MPILTSLVLIGALGAARPTPTPMARVSPPPTPAVVDYMGPPPVLPPPQAYPTPGTPATPAIPPTPGRPGTPAPLTPLAQPSFRALPPLARPTFRPIAPLATLRPPGPAGKPTPRPKARPKPAWRPPPGTIYVDGSGVYPPAVRLRWGQPLRLVQPAGRQAPLAMVVVDPHLARSGQLKPLTGFPGSMSADARWTWLGDGQGYKHRHWPIAQGPMLLIQPDTFLDLNDEIWGTGTQWPMRFLFYVSADGTWRRVIVTVDR